MALTCEICGSHLEMVSGGGYAVCPVCGMRYPVARLRELIRQEQLAAGTTDEPVPEEQKQPPWKTAAVEPVPEEEKSTLLHTLHRNATREELGLGEWKPAVQEPILLNSAAVREFDISFLGVLKRYKGQGGNVVLPGTVRSVGKYVFDQNQSINSLVLPEEAIEFKEYSCRGCMKLERVSVAKKLRYIGDYAFGGCEGLEELSVRNHIPLEMGIIGKYAFFHCRSLREIDHLLTGCTFIRESSFEGCESLTEVWIADSVKYIRRRAFAHCRSLKRVRIPESVKIIQEDAFLNCPLERVEFGSRTDFSGIHDKMLIQFFKR